MVDKPHLIRANETSYTFWMAYSAGPWMPALSWVRVIALPVTGIFW